MQTYSKYQPTGFDPRGLALDDQQDWLVVPVGRNRDSGPLDESNFHAALQELGGEGDDVEVHRFGHWACGWFEIIIVRPDSKAAEIAEDIERALENYPVLDEDDLSLREHEECRMAWDSWMCNDFKDNIAHHFGLSASAREALDNLDDAFLLEFYLQHSNEGLFCSGDDACYRFMVEEYTRDDIAKLLRLARQ